MSLKLLYLELSAFDFRICGPEPAYVLNGLERMFSSMRAQRPPRPRQASKIQLMLRTPDGGRWGLTVSAGMDRFIGLYSQVPGLGSDSPLLKYQPVDRARRG